MSVPAFGVRFHRDQPAADIARQAQALEQADCDELWVIEDLFYTAGPTPAVAAFTATDALGVGIGIMPAAVRNPVATAMEIATLASLAPGPFYAGIGHGVQDWMAQIGAREASPVTLLEENLVAVRRLLAGERFSSNGRYVTLDDVGLVTPPNLAPPVSAGVRGSKSLQMSGRCADGTILADLGPIGTPEDAGAYLAAMSDAGADAFAVLPDPDDPVTDSRNFAQQVLEGFR